MTSWFHKFPIIILIFLGFWTVGLPGHSPVQAAIKMEDSQGLRLLEEIQETITTLAEHVTPTVVNIAPVREFRKPHEQSRKPAPRTPGTGSGVIVTEDGFIVTNNHVLGASKEAVVTFSDNRTLIGTLVGRDPDTDLALIKVSAEGKLPKATFGESSSVKVGQWVLAVGNPFGLDRTVTLGIVSGVGRENMNLSRYENFIQTDASINPGNSGGPLFNLRGEVIGINTAIINFAQGIGFAIPSNMAKRVIDQLKSQGRVVRGWLGIGIQDLTEKLAAKFGVEKNGGVLVNEVFEDDPADLAGIKPGDIIIKVGGVPVDSPNKLSRLIANHGPGDVTDIEIIRDGEHVVFAVPLGVRKERPIIASLPSSTKEEDLGFSVQQVTPDLVEQFSLEETEGVVIANIEQGSVAHAEGLRKGDLVKEVNRVPVSSVRDFQKEMEKVDKGETILLRVLRGTRAFYVVLKANG